MPRFRFRLEHVLDHRSPREDLMRQELAQAMAAVAVQQERAVEAQRQVASGLVALRRSMEGPTELAALRARHDDLSLARARAAHERAAVQRLEELADQRRADLMRASREREAISRLRERPQVNGRRREGIAMDELATRRASRRRSGVAA